MFIAGTSKSFRSFRWAVTERLNSGPTALHGCKASRGDPVRRPIGPDAQYPVDGSGVVDFRIIRDGRPPGISIKQPDLLC